jgi:hypothetical protein
MALERMSNVVFVLAVGMFGSRRLFLEVASSLLLSKALVGLELCHGPVSSATAGAAAAAGMDQAALKLFWALEMG